MNRSDAIPVTITGRRLPPFRRRRVAFVANLLSLFYGNDAETALLKQEVGGIESYGGRLIPILNLLYQGGPCDLVLEEEPEPTLLHYFSGTLGLRLPGIHTLAHADYLEIGERLVRGNPLSDLGEIPDRLRSKQLDALDGYVTEPTLQSLASYCQAETLSSLEGSRRGNNKWLLYKHLQSEGLPVFDTVMAAKPREAIAALRELRAKGYARGVIKSQVGASGIGILQLETDDPAPDVPELLFYEGPCMVQGWLQVGHAGITAIHSPSVQLYLDDTQGIYLYDITEQILSQDSVHEGNVSPPPHLLKDEATQKSLYDDAAIAARWLFEQGYRGTASVDFVLAAKEKDAPATAYICEINARVTGATYPSILARHFMPEGAWLMRNLKFNRPQPAEHLLGLLAKSGHLYQPTNPEGGILPINFNTTVGLLVEKGQFLCLAPNIDACERYLSFGERALPIDWAYVRD